MRARLKKNNPNAAADICRVAHHGGVADEGAPAARCADGSLLRRVLLAECALGSCLRGLRTKNCIKLKPSPLEFPRRQRAGGRGVAARDDCRADGEPPALQPDDFFCGPRAAG